MHKSSKSEAKKVSGFGGLTAVLRGCVRDYTVIKAFGGLVIFRAVAGNITSYSREIYAPLKASNPCYSMVFSQL